MKRILVAEDEETYQKYYRSILSTVGYEPIICPDGRSAILTLKELLKIGMPPYGILSDFYMAKSDSFPVTWDGDKFYEEANRVAEEIPFVFVTSDPRLPPKGVPCYDKGFLDDHERLEEFLKEHFSQ